MRVLCLLFALLGLLAWPAAAPAALLDEPVDEREAPTAAPDIMLRDAAGEPVRLSSLRGKPVLLVFWATWCGPCVAEMPGLNRLQKDYAAKGLRVVPVSVEIGNQSGIKSFYSHHNLDKLPLYTTSSFDDQKAYEVRGVPKSFILDAKGWRVWRFSGGVDWDSEAAREIVDRYVMP